MMFASFKLHASGANSKIKELAVYLLLSLLVAPSVAWIMLDRTVWPWDQAWYGEVSVDLFYTLTRNPANWVDEMMQAIGTKPPAIAWAGQFFVPLGNLMGSIDAGLLVSVLLVQLLSLILMYHSLRKLSPVSRRFIPITGSIIIASAPLFVGMSHQYFVEPMQTLAVVWFILIMSFAPKWDRAFILGQLLAAAAFAMLAKASSPIYCVGPGLVALKYVFRPGSNQRPFNRLKKRALLSLAGGVLLSALAIGWYNQNLADVIRHVSISSSGPTAELFGKSDTFVNNLIYWLRATQRSFFIPVALGAAGLAFIGGVAFYFIKPAKMGSHFTVCAAIALFQIALVILIFSVNINRENRYLLPLLPYISLLLCWALVQIDKRAVTGAIAAVFLVQLILIFGQALAVSPPASQISGWVRLLNRNPADEIVLKAVVARTCTEKSNKSYSVIGVELPELNYHSAAYFSAKQRLENGLRCRYTSLGFAEDNPDQAEEFIKTVNPLFFVSIDPTLRKMPSGPFNQVTMQILERARATNLVELGPPLAEDPAVLIFHRVWE